MTETENRSNEIIALYKNNHSIDAISEIVKISKVAIYKILKTNNIQLNDRKQYVIDKSVNLNKMSTDDILYYFYQNNTKPTKQKVYIIKKYGIK